MAADTTASRRAGPALTGRRTGDQPSGRRTGDEPSGRSPGDELPVRQPGALALHAAALFAVDPHLLGGLRLRGAAGPVREAWLRALRAWLPEAMPWQRMPVSISEDRLLGGLDLAASLAARRSVLQEGLLAQCHGGIVVVPMAERLPAGTAANLAAVLDRQELVLEREGFARRMPARLAVVALDEALPDDEPVSAALCDRLALDVALDGGPEPKAPLVPGPSRGAKARSASGVAWDASTVAAARARLASVEMPEAVLEALCEATLAMGIGSARAALFAVRAARAAAALAGRTKVNEQDAALAAMLVLAPRATRLPAPEAQAQDDEETPAPAEPPPEPPRDSPPPPETHEGREPEPAPPDEPQPLDEQLIAAALAALPPGLLAQLVAGGPRRKHAASEGRAGALAASRRRGAPLGVRPGDPRRGERLNLIETVRAAIPWQRLRTPGLAGKTSGADAVRSATTSSARSTGSAPAPRLTLRMQDLRVTHRAQHQRSTTLFVIDASGSSALHRLAEAKGAVEQLLAESYVRRDEVAVIAFRGQCAEVLLPPTRSLVRAKRALAGLPGGGGTPIAAALDAADALIEQIQRRGATPSLVLLTDGRANVARDPAAGRAQAQADAIASARRVAVRGARAIVIDTSPRPAEAASLLAAALGARYLPLPHLRADRVTAAVRALSA